jgi:hypothetical protein
MTLRNGWLLGWTVLLLAVGGGHAHAAVARFHYVPAEVNGKILMQPAPGTGTCETWLGLRREPNPCPPKANMFVTLCHKCTGQPVVVPLWLPLGTPTLTHRPNGLMYNYGSFSVTVTFYPDGSVDVIYNSGLFRDL